jgi:hypothetical protein
MLIDNLIVTQHRLRYMSHIPAMVDFIENGGVWSLDVLERYAAIHHPGKVSPLIQISQFEDGECYIHDGHHRIVTMYLGGRHMLHPEEYKVTQWTYDQYLEINVQAGWFTPFDPRTHCRKEDLALYKIAMKSVLDVLGEDMAITQISHSLFRYAEPRLFRTVKEMAESLCLVV